jgi:hypothetical protein
MVLLGCFGAGAIGGALLMQTLRSRYLTKMIVSAGVVILAIAIVTIARLRSLSALAAVVLVSGAAWVLFIFLINDLVQNLAPDWVRARVLAIFTLVYMGVTPWVALPGVALPSAREFAWPWYLPGLGSLRV